MQALMLLVTSARVVVLYAPLPVHRFTIWSDSQWLALSLRCNAWVYTVV